MNPNPKTEVAIQAWGEAPGTARRVRAGLDVRGLGAFERAYAAIYSELVRKVGQSYSLDQLADVWREADRWAPDVALDAASPNAAATLNAAARRPRLRSSAAQRARRTQVARHPPRAIQVRSYGREDATKGSDPFVAFP